MGSIKAYVGNILKVDGEDQVQFEGIGLYVGQEGAGPFNWQTAGIALSANLVTVNAAIRQAIIDGSETAGNEFGISDTVTIAGGPSIL